MVTAFVYSSSVCRPTLQVPSHSSGMFGCQLTSPLLTSLLLTQPTVPPFSNQTGRPAAIGGGNRRRRWGECGLPWRSSKRSSRQWRRLQPRRTGQLAAHDGRAAWQDRHLRFRCTRGGVSAAGRSTPRESRGQSGSRAWGEAENRPEIPGLAGARWSRRAA